MPPKWAAGHAALQGGGCQFLGTAATSQVIAEALGMALPHSALAPSGEPVWLDMAHRSALALLHLKAANIRLRDILTQHALENAMLVHAAVGGSTNLLLHVPAIAHAAGLNLPTVADWQAVNRSVPRLVDALPNGPRTHPTVQVFFAGAVPEVMLHLRAMGLLHLDVLTVSGQTLGDIIQRNQVVRKTRDGDEIDIVIDRNNLEGRINLVAADGRELAPPEADHLLSQRTPHPDLHAHAQLPDDSRLWAALQQVGGGVWNGCIYDVDRIVAVIEVGLAV
ncbi:MAG TPA: dihydroxy-acid dehydratase [Aggregatilineaceae bacterium]|nr:dihydroxy-acid dehydratase [Aggregatilineaceae bacterium]